MPESCGRRTERRLAEKLSIRRLFHFQASIKIFYNTIKEFEISLKDRKIGK